MRLDDVIMIYPIGLAIGFFICMQPLSDALRLRKKFHNEYLKYLKKLELKESNLTLITPLWIYPIDPKLNQIMRFALLSIPFIIFIVSWYINFKLSYIL